MRKLMILLITLFLMAAITPGLAEENQVVTCSAFSIELPSGWTVDVDEYTRAAYPIVNHILHPVMIWAGNEDYALLISLYNYDSDVKYSLGSNKNQGHFIIICEHSGLTNETRTQPSHMVQSKRDNRNFFFAELSSKNELLATYYSDDKSLGYTFSLKVKNAAITMDDAEALLRDIVSSLREPGLFYPSDVTGRTVVITHASAHIRSAADTDSEKLKTAMQGETFPHYGQTGSWYIINVDGETGYVSTGLSTLQ